jgi:hypothetical protein
MDTSQLKNVKKRLEQECIIFMERLNQIEPEIRGYEEAEQRMKRIEFLIDSRKDMEDIRFNTQKHLVEMGSVKKIILKDLKKKRKKAHSPLKPLHEKMDINKNEYMRDVKTVK